MNFEDIDIAGAINYAEHLGISVEEVLFEIYGIEL